MLSWDAPPPHQQVGVGPVGTTGPYRAPTAGAPASDWARTYPDPVDLLVLHRPPQERGSGGETGGTGGGGGTGWKHGGMAGFVQETPLSIAVPCAGVFCNCFIYVWLAQSERATFHCACADYSAVLHGLQIW